MAERKDLYVGDAHASAGEVRLNMLEPVPPTCMVCARPQPKVVEVAFTTNTEWDPLGRVNLVRFCEPCARKIAAAFDLRSLSDSEPSR